MNKHTEIGYQKHTEVNTASTSKHLLVILPDSFLLPSMTLIVVSTVMMGT